MRRWRSSPSAGGFLSVRNVPVPCCVESTSRISKLAVRAHHRVRIDREIHRELSHGGQLIAGVEAAGRYAAQHLVDDLAVGRNAAARVQRELNPPVIGPGSGFATRRHVISVLVL